MDSQVLIDTVVAGIKDLFPCIVAIYALNRLHRRNVEPAERLKRMAKRLEDAFKE